MKHGESLSSLSFSLALSFLSLSTSLSFSFSSFLLVPVGFTDESPLVVEKQGVESPDVEERPETEEPVREAEVEEERAVPAEVLPGGGEPGNTREKKREREREKERERERERGRERENFRVNVHRERSDRQQMGRGHRSRSLCDYLWRRPNEPKICSQTGSGGLFYRFIDLRLRNTIFLFYALSEIRILKRILLLV